VKAATYSHLVRLPDVHLCTARAILAGTTLRAVWRSGPAVDVGFTTNELDVVGALAVAVTSSVLGAGLVGGRQTTIKRHLAEVDGAIETAGQGC